MLFLYTIQREYKQTHLQYLFCPLSKMLSVAKPHYEIRVGTLTSPITALVTPG